MYLSIMVVVLLIVFYRFAIKGKIGDFSSGVGNALFQAHTFSGRPRITLWKRRSYAGKT